MDYTVLPGLRMFEYDITPNTIVMWKDGSGLTVWDKNSGGADINFGQIASLVNALQKAYEYIQLHKGATNEQL